MQSRAKGPVAQIVEGEVLDHAGVTLYLTRQAEGDTGQTEGLSRQKHLDGVYQTAQQIGALLLGKEVALAGQRATGEVKQRHIHVATAKTHGEKLEAALVNAQQGLTTAAPHRTFTTGDHQPPIEQLPGDLGDTGWRETGQAGEIGARQLLVLFQAGIDQAVVELPDQIDTTFHDLIHRVWGKG